jgi:hypothetical protein
MMLLLIGVLALCVFFVAISVYWARKDAQAHKLLMELHLRTLTSQLPNEKKKT